MARQPTHPTQHNLSDPTQPHHPVTNSSIRLSPWDALQPDTKSDLTRQERGRKYIPAWVLLLPIGALELSGAPQPEMMAHAGVLCFNSRAQEELQPPDPLDGSLS